MCVGVPGIIESCDDATAIVDIAGTKREISLLLMPEPVTAGDWVLVHAGFAMTALDPDEAKETLQMMMDMVTDEPE